MKTLSLIALLALAACTPAPRPADAPSAEAARATAAKAVDLPLAPSTFVIGAIDQDETDIMGCTTMLSRKDPAHSDLVFLEDAVDTDAKGFMKIDGAVVRVGLTSSTRDDDKGIGNRLFANADNTLSIVESYKIGEQHQEADSVDMSGTLTVTWKGMTQTFLFDGGTAC